MDVLRKVARLSALIFDLEDGPGGAGGGRALLEASSPSSAGLVLSNFPPQRRESFLYRSDSEFEMSPKSVSRHSSIGSEATSASAVAPQTSAFAGSLQSSTGAHAYPVIVSLALPPPSRSSLGGERI
ncbi:hypothetical protein HPB48_017713 [Haemaphysalis longicornis]|uniref:Uncharacterized protein n=1 Tax=Haemaphysalis longicornis TaxID=44386 RepID=A0A9J6FTM9_HAELO|nr:hypothetical protein HPB48_017713 [Haemaphysalis longicornis]